MRTALRIARSIAALLTLVVFYFGFGVPVLYLYVLPRIWRRPRQRARWTSWFMRAISRGLLRIFRLGGANFAWQGVLPTEQPILVLMNHQSLLDIPIVAQLASDTVPAFVARSRYARFIPLVSTCIRLLRCPIVHPRRDPLGSLKAVEEAAHRGDCSLVIFPEGHRSRDGEIRPFRAGGIQAVLAASPRPVFMVVSDGLWGGRRFVDIAFNVPRLQGRTEVLGPYPPPDREDQIPAFIASMREIMVAHLRGMRERHAD